MEYRRDVSIVDDAGTTHEMPEAVVELARDLLGLLREAGTETKKLNLVAIALHRCFDDGYV